MGKQDIINLLKLNKMEVFTIERLAFWLKQDRSVFVSCRKIKEEIDKGQETDIKYEKIDNRLYFWYSKEDKISFFKKLRDKVF